MREVREFTEAICYLIPRDTDMTRCPAFDVMSHGRWCCVVVWLAAVTALSLVALYLPSTTTLWGLQRYRLPTPMVVNQHHPLHPTFNKFCYVYSNVTARNTCCKMFGFKKASDMLQCIKGTLKTLILQQRQKRSSSSSSSFSPGSDPQLNMVEGFTNNGSIHNNTHGVHWALVGDSHVRYIFDVIIRRVTPSHLQYTLERFKQGYWRDVHILLDTMRLRGPKENVEVRHQYIPFYITWYWDRVLKKLPRLMKQWESGEHLKPSLIILDTGLHWMLDLQVLSRRLGQAVAAEQYGNYLRSLAPELTRLAANTTVVFKLLDDLQAAYDNSSNKSPYIVSNFERYNSLARQALEGTGVVVWDSTLPLSQAYTQECLARPKTTPVTFWWKCEDKRHVGYILVEQYVDMILNGVCNKHLNLGAEYCL